MEKEIDGGVFSEIKNRVNHQEEELKKQANNNNGQKENENQFITGDPSMITTDEVFALLGEQMVKAKNWAKIALAWNKNFNTLKQSITQKEFQTASIGKQNQELKSSNDKYIITNQNLDKRITDLNAQIRDYNTKNALSEKAYREIEIKYKDLEKKNQDSKVWVDRLIEENSNLKYIKDADEKEKIELKQRLITKNTKAKKPKA
jgi:predicted RNase H-like nuclease (RuvC/YqgF family)